jgi:hypothetical protein
MFQNKALEELPFLRQPKMLLAGLWSATIT